MTTLNEERLILKTESPVDTERIGIRLGVLLGSGDIVCLSGSLGAGKTCLIRGMACGWGAAEQATSPTFTLINEYRREADDRRFYHMDSYRLSGAADALSTGLDDILDAGEILAVEWPENILNALPADRLWIAITDQGEDARQMELSASGPKSISLLRRLRESLSPATHS